MRKEHPVGTLFRLDVKLIHREGTPLLYAHHAAPFEKVSSEEAQRFIATLYGRNKATS